MLDTARSTPVACDRHLYKSAAALEAAVRRGRGLDENARSWEFCVSAKAPGYQETGGSSCVNLMKVATKSRRTFQGS